MRPGFRCPGEHELELMCPGEELVLASGASFWKPLDPALHWKFLWPYDAASEVKDEINVPIALFFFFLFFFSF